VEKLNDLEVGEKEAKGRELSGEEKEGT